MDSVVKLRVDSKEYEAKIRRAADGLRAFGENCQKAGQSVAKADKNTLEYVRAIGQMETVSKTVRGKIGEMTTAFTELSAQYKHLTDQEKQSPFGVALAQSLDQLKNRVKDAKADLQSIGNELGGKDSGGAGGGMGKLGGMLSVFGGNMLTKAAGWAMNFASEIGNCVEQGIELAKAGEGIRMAFERLNRPDLLDNLREATHGTVTDIELMKQAVKFNDFKLSLDEMGTLLAFAQQKAKDTGESVDYMVDSIVTGLGRQSLPILDNLGISANEVKEKMKSTGDMTKAVAEIIKQQMSNAGDYIETAADRAAKADTDLKNAMEELGRTFGPIESAGASMWNTLEVGALKLLNNAIKPLIDRFTELGRLRREYELGGGASRVSGELDKLGNNKSEQNYKMLLAHYDLEINRKQQQLASLRNDAKMNAYTAGSSKFYAEQTNKLQAEIGALYKMRTEFVQGADKIFNPPAAPAPAGGGGGGGTATTRTGRGGGGRGGGGGTHQETPEEKAAKLVAAALGNYENAVSTATLRFEMGMDNSEEQQKKLLAAQERLTMAYADAYNLTKNETYKTKFGEEAGKFNQMEDVVRGKRDLFNTATTELASMAVNPMEGILKQLLGEDMETYAKRKGLDLPNGEEKAKEPSWMEKTSKNIDKYLAPVSTISSGLQEMGIKVPEGIERMIAITQGVSTILAGISALVALIQIDTKVTAVASTSDALIPFALGGVVGHAAGGLLAGHHFSGDNMPVLVNSGELILNRAQQGNIASQLTSGGIGNIQLEAVIEGEDIRLAVRNANRRRGRGEYVTTKTR